MERDPRPITRDVGPGTWDPRLKTRNPGPETQDPGPRPKTFNLGLRT